MKRSPRLHCCVAILICLSACGICRAEARFTDEQSILAIAMDDANVDAPPDRPRLMISQVVQVLVTYQKVSMDQYLVFAHQPGSSGSVRLESGTFLWEIEPDYAAVIVDHRGQRTFLLHARLLRRDAGAR